MSVVYDKTKRSGRKPDFHTLTFLYVLRAIGMRYESISATQIAKYVRDDDTIKKFSNEYKIIKKLHKDGFLKVELKPTIVKSRLKAIEEYEQTQFDYNEHLSRYHDKTISNYELQAKQDRVSIAKERLSKIDEKIESRGSKDWRYSLSFRGFLLYLFNEYDQETKNRTRIIHKVILNPLVLEQAPFLRDSKHFEQHGFDVIDMLFQIAVELRNQLHIDAEDDFYLLRRASERYFVELENYFHHVLDSPLFMYHVEEAGIDKYHEIISIRNSYREHIIFLQKQWIARQLETLDFIEKQCRPFNITKELHDIIENNIDDSIIQFDELAQKHFISNSDMLDIIAPQFYDQERSEPYYYTYKDKEYLVLNECLVPKSIVDKVKKLLFNGMYLRDSVLLLEKYNIPQQPSQLDVLISQFGFEIIRRGKKWNYYGDPFIVKKTVGNTSNLLAILCLCPAAFFI